MAEFTCDDDVAVEAVEAAAAADRATFAIRYGLRRTQHQIQVRADFNREFCKKGRLPMSAGPSLFMQMSSTKVL